MVVGAGAKILGPITVGANARIGSNAVVVKEVPEGATMVGIPARQVGKPASLAEVRKETASKIGFDAYGVTDDLPDPMSEAINKMLDHIHATEQRFEEMRCALRKLGEHVDKIEPLEMDSWMEDCRKQAQAADSSSANSDTDSDDNSDEGSQKSVRNAANA